MLAYQPALTPTLAYARTPSSCWPLFWSALWTVLLLSAPWLPAWHFFDNPASYLPLHIGLEFVSVAVCAMVVSLGWNLLGSRQNSHVAVLGAGFLYIGLAVFAHLLSYKGMPDFVTPSGPEKAIFFWLAERLGGVLCVAALLVVPARQWPFLRCHLVMLLAFVAAAATWWIGLSQGEWLPRTFIEGQGLTAFKIGAEYLFSSLDALVGVLLLWRARRDGSRSAGCLGSAAWSLALSGLYFTLYGSVTDTLNVLGHGCKASAYWMIYRALFAEQIQAPARALVEQESRLEQLVEKRTGELRSALGQFRIFVEQAPTAIAMFDQDMNYVAASVRWMRTFADGQETPVGRGLYQCCPVLPPSWKDALARAAAGIAREGELERWIRGDGKECWLKWAAYPWRDQSGRVGGVILSAEDITSLKRAEAQLLEREAQLRELSESLPQLVWTCSRDGRCDYLSPQWVAYTGAPAASQLGRGWLDYVHPDDREATHAAWKAAQQGQGRYDSEFRLRRHDGAYRWFRSRAVPLTDRDGNILRWFGTSTDVDDLKQAEEALRLATERLQTALKASAVSAFSQDRDLRYTWSYNPALGHSAEEVLGRQDGDLVERPEDALRTEAIKRDVMATGCGRREEIEVRHRGLDRHFELVVDPLRDPDGEIVGVTCAALDITERKASEMLIRRSEENLRLALSAARMSVFEYDLAAGMMRHRGPGSDELGLPGTFSEGDFFVRVHPEDLPGLVEAMRSPVPAQPTYDHEYRFRLPDGSYRWLADKAQGHFDATGRLVRLIGVNWDVSGRKQSEHKLRRQAERQVLLLDIASTLLLAWHDRSTLARTVFERICSHLDAEVGLYFRLDARTGSLALLASFGILPEDEEPVRRLALGEGVCGRVAATGTFLSLDRAQIESDALCSQIRDMGIRAYTCHPLLATDGTLLGTFSLGSMERSSFTPEEIDFLRTVTYLMALSLERLHAKMEIERLNGELERRVEERTAELEAANRELHGFTYAASHDMKGPLGRINSFSALLERNYRDRLDGDGLMFLDFIRRNARRLSILLDDLLSHAQIEQALLTLEPVEVGESVRRVLDEFDEDMRDIGAVLSLRLPDAPLRVLANRHGLEQVLRNLVGNALKYSVGATPPAIEIGARVDGDACRVWVEDNGVGFDMAYHDRIFEIFRRLHTYDEFPGSGVGLALVKKAMDRMQGRVWAESAPGQGATFFLQFRTVGDAALRPLPEAAGSGATEPGRGEG